MKKLLLLSLTFLSFSFLQAQVTIGATPYTTLRAAFAAINAGTHTGAVTIHINANTTETSTAVLNASGTGAANYTSVTIFPTVSGLKISGSINAALISLTGADNVTFDGRVNATGSTRDLAIVNNNTGSGACDIQFVMSAQSNTVKYCLIKGATQATSEGLLFFSTATSGTGNNNNTIDNNSFTGIGIADANRPVNCIFSLGTAGHENSGNIISNNSFFDFDRAATPVYGIKIVTNNNSWTISGNSFYQTASVMKTVNGANLNVIFLNNTGSGFVFSNNFIGGSSANCGGSAWTTTGVFNQQFYGISITAGGCSIQGNTIANMSWRSTNINPWFGIQVNAGTYDIGSTSSNTIGSASVTGSIQVTNSTVNSTTIGINIASTGAGTIANNRIAGINAIGSATISHNIRGIAINAVVSLSITNNIIGSTTIANSISATSASTSATGQSVIGINNNGNGGTLTASGNTIANLSNNYAGTDVNGQVIGIKSTNGVNTFNSNTVQDLFTTSKNAGTNGSASVIGISQTSTTAGQTVSGNTIKNLNNTATTGNVHAYGIFYQGATSGTNAISGNFIRSISLATSGTSGNITGIRINSGASTCANNIVSLGTGINTGYVINGIYENGAAGNNNNIYYNTVYIGGTPASGSNTAAFYSNANTNTRNYRNNIFNNARSGGATHYAAYFNYASAGSLTLNHNDYFANGTGGVLGFFNGSNVNSVPLVPGLDAASFAISPAFSNAGGTNPNDYLPTVGLGAITIAGVSSDFLGNTRAANPTMGALENGCPPPSAPTNTTIASHLTICNGATTTLSASGTGTLSWYDASSGGTYLGTGSVFTTAALTTTTSFFVQDSTCAASSRTTIVVTVGSALVVTPSQSDVSCFGGGNGSAQVSVSGGNPSYTYAWTPSGGSAATSDPLFAGTYTCTITDASGCSATQSFTITQPTQLTATKTIVNVSCFGGSDGSATVVTSGGTPGYTYAWTPLGGNAASAVSLVAGSYACTITDANGCSIVKNCLITQPSPISATTTQTDNSCAGDANGSATVSPSGGTAGYTYSWAPSGGNASVATSLLSGTYTCTITDANGCTLAQTVTITEPPAIVANPSQTDVTCNGAGDGTATVNVTGGNPGYTYVWSPAGGNGSTASSLTPGNYTCTITDASSCFTTQTFTITEPAVLTATTSQVDIACFGSNNGSATVSVSGGTNPYTYAWSPSGGSAATASSLSAGSYTCTITDPNLCSITRTFTITEPVSGLSISTSGTNGSCNNNDGSATATVLGGTPPYNYAWSPGGQTTATASALPAATYTCNVTDANGCSISGTIIITHAACGPTQLTPASCGVTLTALNQNINCIGVTGATNYRYQFVQGSTTVATYTRGNALTNCDLSVIPALQYGQTYQVSVSTFLSNAWGPYGITCSVTTPAFPAGHVSASSCGTTLVNMTDPVYCNSIVGATNYQWKFMQGATVMATYTRGTNIADCVLSNVVGVGYGQTYDVYVRAYEGGVWGPYGTSCTITTPAFPTTQVSATWCNGSVTNLSSGLGCDAVAGATNYQWKAVNGTFSAIANRGSNQTNWRMSWIPGTTVSTTYTVTVRAYVGNAWGPFGAACTVTIGPNMMPLYPGDGIVPSEVRAANPDITYPADQFTMSVYPNPFSENITVTTDADVQELSIFNSFGELVRTEEIRNGVAELHLGDLAAGIYLIQAKSLNGVVTQKVIKQ